MRLDLFLADHDVSISRSQIRRLIDEGQIIVNGMKAKAGYKLRTGDVILYEEKEVDELCAQPEDIPVPILFEDQYLLVIDKPAGMVVHPAAGNYRGTLVNALLHHCRDLTGIGGVIRPGIVHRLDKDTSGLIVVAKTEEVLNGLQRQFKEHQVRKIYQAIVFGDLREEEGIIDAPVGRHPTDRKKMSTVSKRGKEALTRWRALERFGVLTLLEARIETGRTHQIRVHLNSIGHPVLGDNVYGNSTKRIQNIPDNTVRSRLKMLKRQALHAAMLGFIHPMLDRELSFSAHLPQDMKGVLTFMRGYLKNKFGEDAG